MRDCIAKCNCNDMVAVCITIQLYLFSNALQFSSLTADMKLDVDEPQNVVERNVIDTTLI